VTLTLCAFITLIPAEASFQIFFSLVITLGTLVVGANYNPYLQPGDDILYQFCQVSLALAMATGLLEKASAAFQDSFFGPILIVGSITNVVLGITLVASEAVKVFFGDQVEEVIARKSLVKRDSGGSLVKKKKPTLQDLGREVVQRNSAALAMLRSKRKQSTAVVPEDRVLSSIGVYKNIPHLVLLHLSIPTSLLGTLFKACMCALFLPPARSLSPVILLPLLLPPPLPSLRCIPARPECPECPESLPWSPKCPESLPGSSYVYGSGQRSTEVVQSGTTSSTVGWPADVEA
jgi:hypothetical protein